MKVKITSLGVNLHYPLGTEGPYRTLRRYKVEAADGRIDVIDEWDEDPIQDGEYNFSKETVDSIFNQSVELDEDEW